MLKFKEGEVVSCMAKVKVEDAPVMKTGTVWMVSGTKYFILDSETYVHGCESHEVFEVQNDQG